MTAASTAVPPQNIEAEEQTLASMMVTEAAVASVIDEVGLTAKDFYLDRHRAIFEAMSGLYSQAAPIDELTVDAALTPSQRTLVEAGGVEAKHYLGGLTAKVRAAGNAKHYAQIVLREGRAYQRMLLGLKLAQPDLNGEVVGIVNELVELVTDPTGTEAVDRWADGAAFILDTPEAIAAVWGQGQDVVHADGEPLLIAAPPGAGKTTLAQQYALAQAGIGDGTLLGLPVAPVTGKVVYVAADRPAQAARSFRRMVAEADREALAERLLVWRGPLPFDLAAEPHLLTPFLKARDAGAVVIDSLGATAFDLASDEAGGRVFAAVSEVTAEGIQATILHHDRKREQGSERVRTLDDVYGSRWLTAAAGSVIYLDAKAGDLIVNLLHLKQPAGEIGPLKIRHDHEAGRSVIHEPTDLMDLAANGITVKEAASILFDKTDPTDNEIEKARRRLDKLADRGDLERTPKELGCPTVYRTAEK